MYKTGRALSFGKHKGEKIERVISTDPEYVVWCLDHIEEFDLDNELYSKLENELRAAEHKRNSEYWNALRDGQQRRNRPTASPTITISYADQEQRVAQALGDVYGADSSIPASPEEPHSLELRDYYSLELRDYWTWDVEINRMRLGNWSIEVEEEE